MAVDSNGRLAESSHKGMNGHTKAPKPILKKKGGFSIFSMITRLLTWYSIITILFRCPSTVDTLTETSSKICKPYFQLRSIVAPHLKPYYDEYASPYVNTAWPYYDKLNQMVISPVSVIGVKYGGPQLHRAQEYTQAQWEKLVQPQVVRYQKILREKYDRNLGPHVDTAYSVANPYYEQAKTNAFQTYYGHILPTYNTVQPYALQAYTVANDFAVETAVPYSYWAWTTGAVFLDRTVWPKVRILYGENIEPQLIKIGDRLGSYKNGKKIKAAVEEFDNVSSASSASSVLSSVSSSVAAAYATTSTISSSQTPMTTRSEEVPEFTPPSEIEVREQAQKVITKDLKEWQEKFAKAADEGSDVLEEEITSITERQISSQANGVGKAHLVRLEETIKSSMKNLKDSIISIVRNSDDAEESEEKIGAAVRKAGMAIKDKAQAVRDWKETYDHQTNTLVAQSAEDTFAILDHIRDLGLQEIGMRWAWTDGVTHKDWARYHKLKTKFDEWRYDVEKVVTGHPGLEKARAAAKEIEDQAMGIAEDTANELVRLKETGRWKLSAGDISDDWSTKHIPAAAAVAGKKIQEKISKVSEAIAPSQAQGTFESVVSIASSSVADAISSGSSMASSELDSVQSIASSASINVVGTSTGNVESMVSAASASASSLVDQASSSIIGTSQGVVESVASLASESASSLSAKASSSIIGTKAGVGEEISSSVSSAASVVSKSASSIAAQASSKVSSGSSEISESASKASRSLSSVGSSIAGSVSKSTSVVSSSVSSVASSISSTASKKVWGGAMAQHVEERKIIFEDIIDDSEDGSFSEKLQSLASQAGDRYSDVTNIVSEAILKTQSGEAPAITKLAADKYTSALSAASIALYGTEKGTGEVISSAVGSRYSDAVAAASSVIYGTPTPLTDSLTAQATDLYSAAVLLADTQYQSACDAISALVSGEPKPAHQHLFDYADKAYSDSLSVASAKYQSVSSAGSTAVYGTPTPAYQSYLASVSSLASSKLSMAVAAANEQWESSKSFVGALETPRPNKEKLLGQMKDQYYAAIGLAHVRYSEFATAASSAILPRQTPMHESIYSRASEAVVGTTTHRFDAALSTASAYFSSASSDASKQFDDILSTISALSKPDLALTASSKYSEALAAASSTLSSINSAVTAKLGTGASAISEVVYGSETPLTESLASAASSAIYGGETPWTESVASVASENWEALITKASSQIYGSPTPYFITRRLLSEAEEYMARASSVAGTQYTAVQRLIGELVAGKEPDFTASVYDRLSSAYYTMPAMVASSASSYAHDAYTSASSAVSAMWTPPQSLESILDEASSQVNAVVEAASIQLYGSQKGQYEQATEAAASYATAVSEKIYGTQPSYIDAAQMSIVDAALSAQKAINEAVYGTQTATAYFASFTDAAGKVVARATDAVGGGVDVVKEAIWGPEETNAVQSAQARLAIAIESARVRITEMAVNAGEGVSDTMSRASEGVEDFASSVSSVVTEATGRVRDEL